MWAAGFTVEEIQRRERWASQCFRLYLWESRNKAKQRRWVADVERHAVSMISTNHGVGRQPSAPMQHGGGASRRVTAGRQMRDG